MTVEQVRRFEAKHFVRVARRYQVGCVKLRCPWSAPSPAAMRELGMAGMKRIGKERRKRLPSALEPFITVRTAAK